ncbi:hypothetical protein E4T38_09217 [Aureobasidium subglaciale]|nr:hypothetical protein E4T38_09217 [Aureobasidium subglaciale]KAI5214200.1 hypothetical protein E4T40_09131 [Aureobasidium subglaciale]KAI5216735.1 hypothetical protein E4T41_09132 [Aureobasidium subglaciale]KAI5254488.1 hypothetical protein E4T46_09124 [Aureobasidium subglaciale]
MDVVQGSHRICPELGNAMMMIPVPDRPIALPSYGADGCSNRGRTSPFLCNRVGYLSMAAIRLIVVEAISVFRHCDRPSSLEDFNKQFPAQPSFLVTRMWNVGARTKHCSCTTFFVIVQYVKAYDQASRSRGLVSLYPLGMAGRFPVAAYLFPRPFQYALHPHRLVVVFECARSDQTRRSPGTSMGGLELNLFRIASETRSISICVYNPRLFEAS